MFYTKKSTSNNLFTKNILSIILFIIIIISISKSCSNYVNKTDEIPLPGEFGRHNYLSVAENIYNMNLHFIGSHTIIPPDIKQIYWSNKYILAKVNPMTSDKDD